MSPKWIDWIFYFDRGWWEDRWLGALIILLLSPVFFLWFLLDLIAEKLRIGRWDL